MKNLNFTIKNSEPSQALKITDDGINFNGVHVRFSDIEALAHDSISVTGWINTTRQYFYLETKSIHLRISHVHRKFCLSKSSHDPSLLEYNELFGKVYPAAIFKLSVKSVKLLLNKNKLQIGPYILSESGITLKSWSGSKFCPWNWGPRSEIGSRQVDWTNPFIVHQIVHRIYYTSPEDSSSVKFGHIKCSERNFSLLVILLRFISPQPYENKQARIELIDFLSETIESIKSAPDSELKRALLLKSSQICRF